MPRAEHLVYFDQQDRQSMFQIMKALEEEVLGKGISLLVNVEGRLSLSCREPVRSMSSVFVELATKIGAPIVPVRYVGGLPIEKLEQELQFPLGYGKQDCYLGRPIWPDQLAAIPYAQRKRSVLEAINSTGPDHRTETPNPPDPDFAAEVEAWRAHAGVSEVQAVLYKTLERLEDPSPETEVVLEGVRRGRLEVADSPLGRWLAEFARLLRDIDVFFE